MATFNQMKIASFEQVKVMQGRIGFNKAAKEGACHNFSISWIADIMSNPSGSATERMKNLSIKSGGSNLILQKVFGDRWKLEGANRADELILHIRGLTTIDVFPYKNYLINDITLGLKKNIAKGCLYSFWFNGRVVGAEGGAHSVAFYPNLHGGKLAIHFFDPNYGEFLFLENEFSSFWATLTNVYGPFQNHWMRSCTTKKPIILRGR